MKLNLKKNQEEITQLGNTGKWYGPHIPAYSFSLDRTLKIERNFTPLPIPFWAKCVKKVRDFLSKLIYKFEN